MRTCGHHTTKPCEREHSPPSIQTGQEPKHQLGPDWAPRWLGGSHHLRHPHQSLSTPQDFVNSAPLLFLRFYA